MQTVESRRFQLNLGHAHHSLPGDPTKMIMNRKDGVLNWTLTMTLSIPVYAAFFALVGALLRVPLQRLLEPFAVVSLLHLCFSPLIYWARSFWVKGRGVQWLVVVSGSYLFGFCLIMGYYAFRLGIIPAEMQKFFYVALLVMVPIGFPVYWSLRNFRPPGGKL